jgi:hypothetical protein
LIHNYVPARRPVETVFFSPAGAKRIVVLVQQFVKTGGLGASVRSRRFTISSMRFSSESERLNRLHCAGHMVAMKVTIGGG